MGWTILVLVLTNVWAARAWFMERNRSKNLNVRLERVEANLMDKVEELAESRENDDYLSATGGCNCWHQCGSCRRDEAEYHEQENLDFVASEGVGAMLNVYEPGLRVGYLGLQTWVDPEEDEGPCEDPAQAAWDAMYDGEEERDGDDRGHLDQLVANLNLFTSASED